MARGRPRKSTDDVLMKSAELMGWALGGIEREIAQTRERLASLTAQANRLRERVGKDATSAVRSASKTVGDATAAASSAVARGQAGVRKRRKMSADARRRISEMMKKRWAERRKRNA